MKRALLLASDKRELKGFPECYLKGVIGVGPINAAINSALLIAYHNPDVVVSVGSAVAIDPALKVGEAYSFSRVNNDVLDLRGAFLPLGASLDSAGATISELYTLDTESSLTLTTSGTYTKEMRDSLSVLKSSALDMEAYSLGLTAKSFNLPFLAIKLITDSVGDNSKVSNVDIRLRLNRDRLVKKTEETLNSLGFL